MKLLLDVNIVLDLAIRPKLYPFSTKLVTLLIEKGDSLYIPSCAYTTLYYLLAKNIKNEGAINFLDLLDNSGIRFIDFTSKDIQKARNLKFRDLEDACVAATASAASCDLIITRNGADFKKSPVPAVSPEALLRRMQLTLKNE